MATEQSDGALIFTAKTVPNTDLRVYIENEQIVSNDLFKSSGYAYLANPDSDSYLAWVSSQVRPEDEVTANGYAVFICAEAPASDITVNIIRMEVKNGQ